MEEKEMHDFRFKCVGSVTSARTIDAMSIMRHIIMAMTLIFALAMTMLPVGRVSAETLTPTKDFYVVDSANILSEPTKKHIVSVNRDLEKKTGAQIVVATVNSLDGRPIEEYAIDLARSFGIGDRVKNNGVLFLVSKGDREMRIEVGYGLEGRLNDGKCGSIRDKYIVPYLKDDKWDEGVMNGFDALVAEVAAEYDVKVEGARDPEHGGSMTDQFVDWIFDDVIDGSFTDAEEKEDYYNGFCVCMGIAALMGILDLVIGFFTSPKLTIPAILLGIITGVYNLVFFGLGCAIVAAVFVIAVYWMFGLAIHGGGFYIGGSGGGGFGGGSSGGGGSFGGGGASGKF